MAHFIPVNQKKEIRQGSKTELTVYQLFGQEKTTRPIL
jgi:hypothetical protein